MKQTNCTLVSTTSNKITPACLFSTYSTLSHHWPADVMFYTQSACFGKTFNHILWRNNTNPILSRFNFFFFPPLLSVRRAFLCVPHICLHCSHEKVPAYGLWHQTVGTEVTERARETSHCFSSVLSCKHWYSLWRCVSTLGCVIRRKKKKRKNDNVQIFGGFPPHWYQGHRHE